MKDPFENWTYGDWANLKLFDEEGQILTPYPDLNESLPDNAPDDEEKEDNT